MNRNYVRGRNSEYAAIKRLRTEGAVFAQRTAGSHSPIDVVALMPDGLVRLIQVKSDSSPLNVKVLAALPAAENVSIELWHFVSGDVRIYRQ